MTTQHSLTAPRAEPPKTRWKVGSFAPSLTSYAQPRGPLASGDARRFDQEALESRLADADEHATIARRLAERMVDDAARTAAVELPGEVRAFICREITRANAFVHALQLLRAALPQARLSVKHRTGDRDEPVWLVARGAFDSATVMVDQLEQLQAAFRAARGRGWDSSVMLDLRRER